MLINDKELLWAEKYRPQRVEDMILPSVLKDKFKNNDICNMLLVSETPGTGKTSLTNAIIKQNNLESLFINASLESSIETLRGKIKTFASQRSFNGLVKVVILDECDNYKDDFQFAFRGVIEEFSANCRFLLTCNYAQRIIEPIRNRLEVYNFDVFMKTPEMTKEIFKRLCYILDNENINYNKENLIDVIRTFNPSIRKMIIFLQQCVINNELIINADELIKADGFNYIINILKQKNYDELVQQCYGITNPDNFYSWVYKNINNFNANNRPQIILNVAKYQDISSRVRDKNLNLCACLTEMVNLV